MGAAAAESPLHAVVIRAGGFGNGDLAVSHCDHIASAVIGADGDLPVHIQRNRVQQLTISAKAASWAGNSTGMLSPRQKARRTVKRIIQVLVFIRRVPQKQFQKGEEKISSVSIAKKVKKRKKKCKMHLDFF